MWQPERRVQGPLPITEKDIAAVNRVFSDAFSDRYRRDGLVGVRVPFLSPLVWRYAIADAGGGAMLWRDEANRIVAFNVAHHSGAEGWMGPLVVRPDRQVGGLGKEIVLEAARWLREQCVTTLGLETMPRTVDNIGFYSRLGFEPGHLTLTLAADARPGPGGQGSLARTGTLAGLEPARRIVRQGEMRDLLQRMAPGYDFTRELTLTLELGLGDAILLDRGGALEAFALCHTVPLTEGQPREEVRVLKVAASDEDTLEEVLDAVRAWAAKLGFRRVTVRCQSAYVEAYRRLVERGYRVRWSDLRMTLAGYPEPRPASGVVWSNWEI